MITYSDLYEALRKEKYNEKLQTLPKNFLTEIKTYFKEKKAIAAKDEESIFSEEIAKTKKQIENAARIIKELALIREKKILSLAMVAARIGVAKSDVDNMLDYELELFTNIAKRIENSEKKMNSLIRGYEEKALKNKLIKFNQDIPGFLDPDNHPLGPFKKGDIANLPKEIAKILIDSKQANLIEG